MPELPEVETIRRQLEPRLRGKRLEGVEVLDPRLTAPVAPDDFESAVRGQRVADVGRRGKYLLVGLEGGATLVMHLRMTGNLRVGGGEERFLRARFALEGGQELRFVDARRFGHAAVFEGGEELEEYLAARLGPEPLSEDFDAEVLGAAAAGRRAPLKSFLLDQKVVAGVGNIYADEALHRARLHPLSPAGSMREEHRKELVAGIREALEAGLRHQGASIDDYRQTDGSAGSMQDEFLVHRREGRPCARCGGEVRRIVVAGRSTYFCPDCQRRLRRPRRRGR